MNIVDLETGRVLSERAPLLGTTQHSSPLTTRIFEGAHALLNQLTNTVKNSFYQCSCSRIVFEIYDALLTVFVTQTQMSLMLHQSLKAADHHGWDISTETKMAISGWAVFGSACGMKTLSSLWNQIIVKYFVKNDEWQLSRDRVIQLFTLAIFYMAYDNLIKKGGPVSEGLFIATTLLGALASIGSFLFATSSSTNKLVLQAPWRGENFPIYYNVSRYRKCMNVITGITQVNVALTTALWNILRELEGKTIDVKRYQAVIIYAIAIFFGGYLGKKLNRSPKQYNVFSMICKFFKDGSLSYAAASALAFQLLHDIHGHPNWDKSINTLPKIICIIVALNLGTFSMMTTRVPFKQIQEGSPLGKAIMNSSIGTKTRGAAKTLFSKCCGEQKKDHEHIKMQDVTSLSLICG